MAGEKPGLEQGLVCVLGGHALPWILPWTEHGHPLAHTHPKPTNKHLRLAHLSPLVNRLPKLTPDRV